MCIKKKRVIHPRYHSPCQTPYTALRSLLSVALSSGMVKSNLIIPFISDKVNVQPFRRHCSVISDEGVQFKTARVFNSTAIFRDGLALYISEKEMYDVTFMLLKILREAIINLSLCVNIAEEPKREASKDKVIMPISLMDYEDDWKI